MSSEDFIRNRREMFSDRMYEAELETAAEEQQAAATDAAGGMEDMGGMEGMGDMGGMEGMGDMGGEEAGAAPEEAPAEEEGELLAAPGKRDEDWYKIKNQHGQTQTRDSRGKWYTPVTYDNREGSGPRKKSYKAQYSKETAGSNSRNVFPGSSGMSSIARGIYENMETSYSEEERKLFEVTDDVKKLISNLEKREKDET